MLNERRKMVLRNTINDINNYATQYNMTFGESLEDWLGEGPADEWLVEALQNHNRGYYEKR
jgi:hypothetical protein